VYRLAGVASTFCVLRHMFQGQATQLLDLCGGLLQPEANASINVRVACIECAHHSSSFPRDVCSSYRLPLVTPHSLPVIPHRPPVTPHRPPVTLIGSLSPLIGPLSPLMTPLAKHCAVHDASTRVRAKDCPDVLHECAGDQMYRAPVVTSDMKPGGLTSDARK
jgi:hypothetical protein